MTDASSPSSDEPCRSANEATKPVGSAPLDATSLAEAQSYGRISFRCDLVDRAIDLVYLSLTASLVAQPLDRWLVESASLENRWWRLAAMFLLITLGHLLVSAPCAYYSGHVLEHRFGLSRQSRRRWWMQYAKRHALTLAFGLLITWALFGMLWTTGRWWWLVAAGGYFVLSIVVGQLAPVLILPLFYTIERLEASPLLDRFAELARHTGLRIEGVYRMKMSDETSKANAMLAGLGATRRVLLGDTLLANFSSDQIATVFAHEVGHHVRRHVPKMIAAGLLFSVAGLFLCDRGLALWVAPNSATIDVAPAQDSTSPVAAPSTLHSTPPSRVELDYRQIPVWSYPFLSLVLALFAQIVEPLQNLLSRQFEREADTYALDATGRADIFRETFHQLARMNKADPDPHPWEVFLFHSHPPISARLALAERWAAQRQAT